MANGATLPWWTAVVIALGAAACARPASRAPAAAGPPPAPEHVREIASATSVETKPYAPAPMSPMPQTPHPSTPTLPELGPISGCGRSAIVVLIDHSSSMLGEPMDLAKAATRQIAHSLGPEDCLGVIVFDTTPARLLRIAPVTNRTVADRALSRISAEGSTHLVYGALEAAFRDVRAATDARHRGVILLSDGRIPQHGLRDLVGLLTEEGDDLSVFALGMGADTSLARMLADVGHGRSYVVRDGTALPGAVAEEVSRLKR